MVDQYARETGVNLPTADAVNCKLIQYLDLQSTDVVFPRPRLVSPNSTYNFGADISLTPKIVSTTRFGYFFHNYHDFGWPTAVSTSFSELHRRRAST